MLNFDKLIGPQVGIVAEDYSIEVDGHLLAIQEAFEDISAINENFADMNAQCVDAYANGAADGKGVEGGTVALEAFLGDPVMEGFLKDTKNAIVKALKAMKDKIMAFFHSAMKYFDALVKNAKSFAEKYEDELKDKDLAGFKYDMFEYTLEKVKLGNVFKLANAELGKKAAVAASTEENGVKKTETAVMSKLCGTSVSSMDAFRKAIYRLLRNGKAVKMPISPNIGTIISELKSGDELADCKEAQSECESQFNEIIKDIEDARDDTETGSDSSKVLKRRQSAFVSAKNISMSAFGEFKHAVVERNGAYKSCLSKALHHSSKDKKSEEK